MFSFIAFYPTIGTNQDIKFVYLVCLKIMINASNFALKQITIMFWDFKKTLIVPAAQHYTTSVYMYQLSHCEKRETILKRYEHWKATQFYQT